MGVYDDWEPSPVVFLNSQEMSTQDHTLELDHITIGELTSIDDDVGSDGSVIGSECSNFFEKHQFDHHQAKNEEMQLKELPGKTHVTINGVNNLQNKMKELDPTQLNSTSGIGFFIMMTWYPLT